MVEKSSVEDTIEKLEKHLKKTRYETAKLLEAASAVLTIHNFHDSARAVFDIAKELTGASSGYVALLSEDGSENEVLFLDAGGLPCNVDENLPMPIRGLREVAYRENRVVYDNDFMKSEWVNFMPKGHVEMTNVLFGPLVIAGKAEGLIGLANKPDDFTDEDSKIMMALANLVAIGLRRNNVEGQLREIQRDLLEKTTELDIYTSLLRHDILNDLQIIFGEVDIIKSVSLENKAIEESALSILSASDRIKRLLTLFQISKIQHRDELMHTLKLISDEVTKIHPHIAIKIHDETNGTTTKTHGRSLIPFVFSNLVRNTVQHAGESSRIEIFVRIVGDNIEVDFVDDGPGLKPRVKEVLFQRGSTTKGEGGLGLYLCKKILEVYGGNIDLLEREKYDKGAAFRIHLPLYEMEDIPKGH